MSLFDSTKFSSLFFKIFIRLPKLEHVGQSTGVASVVVIVEVVVLLVVVLGVVVVDVVVVDVVVVDVVVVVVVVVVVIVEVVVRCSVDVVDVLGMIPSPLDRGFFRASPPWNTPKANISVLNRISFSNEVALSSSFFSYSALVMECKVQID